MIELCPVCKGSGKYPDYHEGSTAGPIERTCHGCDGKGWVTDANEARYPPWEPVLPYWPYPQPIYPIITFTGDDTKAAAMREKM
jgi:hypothetical protein